MTLTGLTLRVRALFTPGQVEQELPARRAARIDPIATLRAD